MGNHYHLLIETPKPNLVVGMKWLQSTFANRFRKANGHVFQGRYQAILLGGGDPKGGPKGSGQLSMNLLGRMGKSRT